MILWMVCTVHVTSITDSAGHFQTSQENLNVLGYITQTLRRVTFLPLKSSPPNSISSSLSGWADREALSLRAQDAWATLTSDGLGYDDRLYRHLTALQPNSRRRRQPLTWPKAPGRLSQLPASSSHPTAETPRLVLQDPPVMEHNLTEMVNHLYLTIQT